MTGAGASLAPAAEAPADEHALRLLIVTDAWAPQVNGVVRTLETLGKDLEALGHEVRYATPEGRFTVPLPTYSEIRLAVFPRRSLEKMIDNFKPDAIHIATEGPLGLSARAICLRRKIPFTTSFHTRFPDYVHARFPFIPESAVYSFLRWFHGPAKTLMVATPSLKQELERHGFRNVRIWSRGVDVERFRPIPEASLPFPHPIWLYVGRVAIEKNIEAFLASRSAGHESHHRRWPCARAARTALSQSRNSWARKWAKISSGTMRRATCSCFPARPTRSAL